MPRIIVLDAGPLSLSCHKPNNPGVDEIRLWLIQSLDKGAIIVVPEIADYEVRRELIRAGAMAGVKRLDDLVHPSRGLLRYAPISTRVMRKAAELWAGVRHQGLPTSDDRALDADVILAAQALDYAGLGDTLTVATDNARHLSRFLDARAWKNIGPSDV